MSEQIGGAYIAFGYYNERGWRSLMKAVAEIRRLRKRYPEDSDVRDVSRLINIAADELFCFEKTDVPIGKPPTQGKPPNANRRRRQP